MEKGNNTGVSSEDLCTAKCYNCTTISYRSISKIPAQKHLQSALVYNTTLALYCKGSQDDDDH